MWVRSQPRESPVAGRLDWGLEREGPWPLGASKRDRESSRMATVTEFSCVPSPLSPIDASVSCSENSFVLDIVSILCTQMTADKAMLCEHVVKTLISK